MRIRRTLFVGVVSVLFCLLAGSQIASADDTTVKWSIFGTASALANDGSTIMVMGSGTFMPGDDGEVTGGGTWMTSGPAGSGSGTFAVTSLVRFDLAPGAVADPTIHAGLVFLHVKYSDGKKGVLVVSCCLPGTPASVFEGITASKGFVDYWNRIPAGTAFKFIPRD